MGPNMGMGWDEWRRRDRPPGWDEQREEEDRRDEEGDNSGGAPPTALPSLLTMKIDTPEEFLKKPQRPEGISLPKALEEALAYKDQRQAALGDDNEKQGRCQ